MLSFGSFVHVWSMCCTVRKERAYIPWHNTLESWGQLSWAGRQQLPPTCVFLCACVPLQPSAHHQVSRPWSLFRFQSSYITHTIMASATQPPVLSNMRDPDANLQNLLHTVAKKARIRLPKMIVLAVLAGFYVAVGGMSSTMIGAQVKLCARRHACPGGVRPC